MAALYDLGLTVTFSGEYATVKWKLFSSAWWHLGTAARGQPGAGVWVYLSLRYGRSLKLETYFGVTIPYVKSCSRAPTRRAFASVARSST